MLTHNNFIKYSLFIVGLILISCQQQNAAEDNNASRILRTLSSDEFMGRSALSPEIVKTENFITDEFTKARLLPFQSESSFKQSFNLNETTVQSAEIKVTGTQLSENKFIGFFYADDVLMDASNAEIQTISSTDNFREKFNIYRRSEVNTIVFVDPVFEDLFGRYRAYYNNPTRYLEGSSSRNVIFVLADLSDDFEVSVSASTRTINLSNIVGMIEGNRSDEYVLFSAHHDHIGVRTAVNSDSIGNGANDNASGVTAVIELANYFSKQPKPERTLLFVTFTAEEFGGYGSKYFSEQLNPDEIVAMFNIEMIGKPALSGSNTAWITGYDRSTFGELLSKSAEGTQYEFYPDPYPDQNLFYRSDNATLARLGVPAHTISTTPIDVDTDYHQVTDEFETIDIAHLINTIHAIAKGAEGIVSGVDTPTRVDTSLID